MIYLEQNVPDVCKSQKNSNLSHLTPKVSSYQISGRGRRIEHLTAPQTQKIPS